MLIKYFPSNSGVIRSSQRAALQLLVATALALASTGLVAAPYVRADKPITDKDGLVKVIIDFAFDAHLRYPGALPVVPERGPIEKPKAFFQTEKTLALVADYERRYGLKGSV